jgi:hypothetical protein
MKLNAHLYHKADDYRAEPCEVEKVIEVSESEFAELYRYPLKDYDFIAENKEGLRCDENGVSHCLLVLGEGNDDGILVCAEGYDYARNSAHIPNARQIVAMEQSSPLSFTHERASQLLDKALDWIGTLEAGGELYDTLVEWFGMSDEEISAAGFDTLNEYFEDPDEDEAPGMKLE